MTKFKAFICRTHLHCILRVEFYKQNLRVEFNAKKRRILCVNFACKILHVKYSVVDSTFYA